MNVHRSIIHESQQGANEQTIVVYIHAYNAILLDKERKINGVLIAGYIMDEPQQPHAETKKTENLITLRERSTI